MSEGAPPGFLRATGAVLLKDLTLEWRTLDALSAMGLFSLFGSRLLA